MEQTLPELREVSSGSGWRLQHVTCHGRAGEPEAEERHDRFLIAIVTSGIFTYHGAAGRDVLHTGSVLLGNCDACYACGHHHGDGDTCMALQIGRSMFEDVAATAAGTMHFRFPSARLPFGRSLLPSALRLEQVAGADQLHKEECVAAFTSHVLREISGAKPRLASSARDQRRIADVLDHMARNSAENLRLKGLAAMARMSSYHFLRVFKAVTGTTPHQHVIHLRLRNAALQLTHTHKPVTDIALDSGFNDLSTFNRTFKSCFGLPPAAMRRQ